jgi:hypothetical protein
VDVGVADAGVLDVDCDIVRSDVASFDGGFDKWLSGGGRGVSGNSFGHGFSLWIDQVELRSMRTFERHTVGHRLVVGGHFVEAEAGKKHDLNRA